MTDKEIKKIAREYAENVKSEYVSAKLIETLVMGFYHSRLKTDYCIVPKEKLDALQDEIHGEIMCAHDDDDWQSVAHYILDVMPRSFNDLFGKDMFEEEKK